MCEACRLVEREAMLNGELEALNNARRAIGDAVALATSAEIAQKFGSSTGWL